MVWKTYAIGAMSAPIRGDGIGDGAKILKPTSWGWGDACFSTSRHFSPITTFQKEMTQHIK